ncbi:MAG: hypothetical protein ACQERJ_09880 [Bacillota bacterium]
MKKIAGVMLVITILCLQVTTVFANPIEVESQVLVVAEDKLVELSAQKKFNNLMVLMKELVRQERDDKELVKLEEITIVNFELVPEQGFKIYYTLN